MGSYVISTPEERSRMLAALGMSGMRDLFRDAPGHLLLDKLDLPAGLSELEVRRAMEALAAENKLYSAIYRGAGSYDHYIPAIVKQVLSKEEFITAYTPYQAEISQGILQSIFEYQTMICQLTGMDVSNASVYDGASAVAEACAMCHTRKKHKTLLSGALHPDWIAAALTYNQASGQPVEVLPVANGRTDIEALKAALADPEVAGVVIAQPNYFGLFEDAEAIGQLVHEAGAKFVIAANPISLGLCKTPAEQGADIAVGDGQPLGMPLAFGGPYLGFMAAKEDMTRQLPGRIVGETVDVDGKRGYVLTLQAREQHIKREKASSSICSNQALCALTASVYLAAMGPDGLKQAAEQSYAKAHYLAGQLAALPGCKLAYEGDFFNEFVIESEYCAYGLAEYLEQADILSGLPLDDKHMLWCCTEKNSKADMDKLIGLAAEYAKGVAK